MVDRYATHLKQQLNEALLAAECSSQTYHDLTELLKGSPGDSALSILRILIDLHEVWSAQLRRLEWLVDRYHFCQPN